MMTHVTQWLNDSCLHNSLHGFTINRSTHNFIPSAFVAGGKLTVVSNFKCLSVKLDSNPTFKKTSKMVINIEGITCQVSITSEIVYQLM